MSEPPRPLKQHLAAPPAPAWDAVERRITRRRWRRYAAWALVPACALALLAPRSPRTVTAPITPPPSLAVGTALPAGTTVLADGTRLGVGAEASIRLTSQDPRGLVFTLLGGEVSFEVTPARRIFRVDAGLATVTVVGTGFTVLRDPRRVQVRVRHGAVRVEGANVPGRSSLLRDGDEIEVRAEAVVLQGPAITTPEPLDAGVRSRPPTERRAPRDGGAPTDAPAPTDVGLLAPSSAPDALWRSADLLRRAQSYEAAAALLLRLTREHPTSPRAPLAAHLLGRDLLHVLRRPSQASAAFARALSLGLSEGLREDAWYGLIEARLRAGDRAGAVQALRSYRARYPRGVHLAAVDALLGASP